MVMEQKEKERIAEILGLLTIPLIIIIYQILFRSK